ncbi:unnamed protein product [Adineta steineri]|uniref:25S rRNA (uridine-N(3))-methyltransferase BMT5-like domain-containing protein n=1 Tax=Adineta steineri TaxID=433720 RepID=A0A813USQ5_9BILA|nr:unnamed protein product [Adineta steineri]
MVEQKDGTGTLWDLRKEHSMSHKIHEYAYYVKKYVMGQSMLFLDQETLVYAATDRQLVQLVFISENMEDTKFAAYKGKWNATAMILLSDGSIMYATDTRDSGIHVVTRDGNVVFSKSDQELPDTQRIHSLKELDDGSIAVESSQSIFILKPQMVGATKNDDYKTELTKLKRSYKTTDLKLDSELDTLYNKTNQSSNEQYQLYLSGIKAAVKSSHLYEARRFYEKARQMQPDSNEPCNIFLSYLETAAHAQLTRRIRIDLLTFTNKLEDLPEKLKNRKCKTRLLIGEGDFSFTKALIDKHRITHLKLSEAITATDWTAIHLNRDPTEKQNQLKQRIIRLTDIGVNVLFGINAEHIHWTFKGRRFKRIQWNCPFGKTSSEEREKFKDTIPQFFLSCSQLQLLDDRVHVTLMQEESGEYWKQRQIENPIVLGSAEAGYRLIRKRSFKTSGEERYPGYNHVKTGTTESYPHEGKQQEFVFEKTPDVFPQATFQEPSELMDVHKKKYKINTDKQNASLNDCYFECSTDEDSSDYYESDSNEDL